MRAPYNSRKERKNSNTYISKRSNEINDDN